MNPRTMLWQAVASLTLLGVVIVFGDPLATVWLAGIGLCAATALNASYARALGRRGRSKRRMHGDRRVAVHVASGLMLPFLAGVTAAALGHNPHLALWGFTHTEFTALLVAAGALIVAVFVSSLVDWYYVRPRIDGLVCVPPCRAAASEKGPWKRVTRRWYLHRGLATLAYIAFAIAIAVIVMIMLVREDPAAAGVTGGVSGIAGLLLIFAGSYRSSLPTVARWVLSPAFVLGDDLEYEGYGGKKRGYVLHLAVPVAKLVPLDKSGRPVGVPFVEIKTPKLDEADLYPKPATACNGSCARLNPECLGDMRPKNRRDKRRHILVV